MLELLSYGLKPSGLYRHRRGLGLHKVGYNGRRSKYPHRQACLPCQGKSHPDTGRSLQSCIFIVQESGEGIVRLPEHPLILDSLNGLPQNALGLREQASWMHTHLVSFVELSYTYSSSASVAWQSLLTHINIY